MLSIESGHTILRLGIAPRDIAATIDRFALDNGAQSWHWRLGDLGHCELRDLHTHVAGDPIDLCVGRILATAVGTLQAPQRRLDARPAATRPLDLALRALDQEACELALSATGCPVADDTTTDPLAELRRAAAREIGEELMFFAAQTRRAA